MVEAYMRGRGLNGPAVETSPLQAKKSGGKRASKEIFKIAK
jgi:hypothetical protein